MSSDAPPSSPRSIAAFGLLGLAAAVGIGRFAFTPLLPLMQAEGLSLVDGAWLASANYLGYLVGALLGALVPPAPTRAIRYGLLAVTAGTLAMALAASFVPWWLLRFGAGVASAYVLIGVSAWSLAALAAAGRPGLSGWVFAGVGVGIVVAGGVALAAAAAGASSARAWTGLGALAAAVLGFGWPVWRAAPGEPAAAARGAGGAQGRLGASGWALILAYGGFGFGYIIPATFIPAAARAWVDDPFVFGWAWPFFGLAAAASTVLAMRGRAIAPRRLATASLLVMSVGVLMPALAPGIGAIVVSAVLVGGTFMVMTMAGLQEARRIAAGPPTRLIAAMTAAFALGQLLGPLWVGRGANAAAALGAPGLVAAGVLLASALLLALGPATAYPLAGSSRGSSR